MTGNRNFEVRLASMCLHVFSFYLFQIPGRKHENNFGFPTQGEGIGPSVMHLLDFSVLQLQSFLSWDKRSNTTGHLILKMRKFRNKEGRG